MGINPKNMGQVPKDFIMKSLEISGKQKINHREIVRRKKIKGTGGEISMTVDVNESVLKKQLDTLIEQKEIHIGHLIMPKKIEKLVLKNNELIKEYFNVYGRKIRLHEIRKALLERLKQYMRYSDEKYYQTLPMDQCTILLQRYNLSVLEDDVNQMRQAIKEVETTRHFSIWHDAATVANHGYVLFMIQNIYNPAVYYTNTEWHGKYPKKTATSIQKIIEQPEVYMIGQCSSSMRINYIIVKQELNAYRNCLLHFLLMMAWN